MKFLIVCSLVGLFGVGCQMFPPVIGVCIIFG